MPHPPSDLGNSSHVHHLVKLPSRRVLSDQTGVSEGGNGRYRTSCQPSHCLTYLQGTSLVDAVGVAFAIPKPMFAMVRLISGEPPPHSWVALEHEYPLLKDEQR